LILVDHVLLRVLFYFLERGLKLHHTRNSHQTAEKLLEYEVHINILIILAR